MKPVRVLVVDDSALIRKVVSQLLSDDPQLEVVGTAVDPFDAREKIKQLNPDVLTLDVEMPRMDGITFLRNLMRLRPMPVVMLSTLTTQGADITLEALEIGAVDFIAKPRTDQSTSLARFQSLIIEKVHMAAGSGAQLQRVRARRSNRITRERLIQPSGVLNSRIIAMGASTGGTEALKEVLSVLPAQMPPIVITQHIPASFSQRFARRLDRACALNVCEAEDRQRIETGHVYIAPGDKHLTINVDAGGYYCCLQDSEEVSGHKPSVDVLYHSLLNCRPERVLAVLMTGMGSDGAHGMKQLHEAGATTLAQDERSSLVWGMPGSAVRLGAAMLTVPLEHMAEKLVRYSQG
ncbi:MAG: chemotaxis response regulator protein-glutamate methylesterase [Marinobacterium sp.]|nr:chemotaxis response regulator protein-glutamate methylesterase [Marinobacterium sp.]